MGLMKEQVRRGGGSLRGDAGASHALGVSAAVVLAGGVMFGITQLDVPRTVACAVAGGVGEALEGGGRQECGVAAGARDVVEMSSEPSAAAGESEPSAAAVDFDALIAEATKEAEEAALVSTYPTATEQWVQTVKSSIAAGLKSELGKRGAGSWIDAESGELRVGVTSASDAALVRARGAVPVRVKRTEGELEAARDEVVRIFKRWKNLRYTMWSDPESNQVVVELNGAPSDADLAGASGLLSRVGPVTVLKEVDEIAHARLPAPPDGAGSVSAGGGSNDGVVVGPDPLLGGDPMGGCSLGFNTVGQGGASTFLTAGHCFDGVGDPSDIALQNGKALGIPLKVTDNETTDSASGLVNGVRFEGVPAVKAPQALGGPIPVVGQEEAPVGATVCKSGKTTGFTCGTIQAHDVYLSTAEGGGEPFDGFSIFDGCVRPGDSGGSVITPGGQAQGIVSRSNFHINDAGEKVCAEEVGGINKAFYVPLADALEAHNASLSLAPRSGR